MKQVQIAIDGPAASGKSTVAKQLAAKIGGYYVNTGDMYRALTMLAQAHGITIDNANPEHSDLAGFERLMAENEICYTASTTPGELILTINGQPADATQVRSPQVASQVSPVAAIPAVREWMLGRQRQSAELGLIIMEGRDIGTVVFPEAQFKFFVTATPEERARRRLAQPGETVDGATLQAVAAEIAKRDKMDSERPIAPLKPAADAIVVDTTGLTIDEVLEKICSLITL